MRSRHPSELSERSEVKVHINIMSLVYAGLYTLSFTCFTSFTPGFGVGRCA